ncbi:MAG: hypothetical protein ACOX4Q_04915 [Syntrophomonadales bacterium]|jgi:F0F1-type ATP synthase membrane subunit b/b'
MDAKQLVQQSMQSLQTSASNIRQAANQTTNVQAKNILTQTASEAENSVKRMQQIINQL